MGRKKLSESGWKQITLRLPKDEAREYELLAEYTGFSLEKILRSVLREYKPQFMEALKEQFEKKAIDALCESYVQFWMIPVKELEGGLNEQIDKTRKFLLFTGLSEQEVEERLAQVRKDAEGLTDEEKKKYRDPVMKRVREMRDAKKK